MHPDRQQRVRRAPNPPVVFGGGVLSAAEIARVRDLACTIGFNLGSWYGDAVEIGHISKMVVIAFGPKTAGQKAQIHQLVASNYHAWCL